MVIDRLDDDDSSADGVAEVERKGASGDGLRREAIAGEVRDRAAYHAELRVAVTAEYEDVRGAREDGGWRGDGNRCLDGVANAAVDRGCQRIREVEESVLSPAMRRLEGEDPGRELAGFEHRLKGADRIKEKVAMDMLEKGDSAEQALAGVPDAVRYTFRYGEQRYADQVGADLKRLRAEGFELIKVKNSWASDQYRGINTQWREPGTGQRFEVQFHTGASLDAKQSTHGAYERLRSPGVSDDEARELRRFQRRICQQVPVPPGAAGIPDYPEGA